MILSLTNYKKNISASVLKHAKALVTKHAVRELDEEEKGTFVAFVDEGAESSDVKLVFDLKNQLIEHQCDCGNTYFFCEHKTSVLIHLIEKGTSVAPLKIKKTAKAKSEQNLFEHVSFEQLTHWLVTLFEKDKALKLEFEQTFSNKDIEYTPILIASKTKEIVKTVVGARRIIEQSELKKIVSLWSLFHNAVLEVIFKDATQQHNLELLNSIISNCFEFEQKFQLKSGKATHYFLGFKDHLAKALQAAENETVWNNLVEIYSLQYSKKSENIERGIYFYAMLDCVGIISEKREEKLIHIIMNQFALSLIKIRFSNESISSLIFNKIKDSKFVQYYLSQFTTEYGQNDYNLELIDLCIKYNLTKRAIELCNKAILNNYNIDYNIPYWERLKFMYDEIGDKKKAIEMAKNLFPLKLNISMYIQIITQIKDIDEATKWKNSILNRVRARLNEAKHIQLFYFDYLNYEGKIKKMMEILTPKTLFDVYIKYFDLFFQFNKIQLLNSLLLKQLVTIQYSKTNIVSENGQVNEVIDLVESNYIETEILLILKKTDQFSYSRRPIYDYFIEKYKGV